MITGMVNGDEARIHLRVTGPRGAARAIDAVIDTGYTGSLTLPPHLISQLRLRWRSVDRGTLADGTECLFDVYDAALLWDGKLRHVLVDETDAEPLVGMRLLQGHELRMQVRPAGAVIIRKLRRSG